MGTSSETTERPPQHAIEVDVSYSRDLCDGFFLKKNLYKVTYHLTRVFSVSFSQTREMINLYLGMKAFYQV